MAIDEKLAAQVRAALDGASRLNEVKMFGGIGFMLNGNMLAGASDRGLLVRVGEAGADEALARPGAEAMVMNGRTMTGYIRVAPGALDARAVKSWIRLARAFVETLPPKKKSAAKSTKPKSTSKRKPTGARRGRG